MKICLVCKKNRRFIHRCCFKRSSTHHSLDKYMNKSQACCNAVGIRKPLVSLYDDLILHSKNENKYGFHMKCYKHFILLKRKDVRTWRTIYTNLIPSKVNQVLLSRKGKKIKRAQITKKRKRVVAYYQNQFIKSHSASHAVKILQLTPIVKNPVSNITKVKLTKAIVPKVYQSVASIKALCSYKSFTPTGTPLGEWLKLLGLKINQGHEIPTVRTSNENNEQNTCTATNFKGNDQKGKRRCNPSKRLSRRLRKQKFLAGKDDVLAFTQVAEIPMQKSKSKPPAKSRTKPKIQAQTESNIVKSHAMRFFCLGIRNTRLMSSEEADMVHTNLISEMNKENEKSYPRYLQFHYKAGWILVTSANDRTYGWLRKKIKNINPFPDAELSIVKESELPNTVVANILVPFKEIRPVMEILYQLKIQNEGLYTEDWWVFYVRMVRGGRLITLYLDDVSVETLKRTGLKAALDNRQINFCIRNDVKKV